MDGDQIARAAYLGLLAVALGGSLLVSNRNSLGQNAQQAAIWGLIFVGVIAGYGLWNDVSHNVTGGYDITSEGQIVAPLQRDGHYYLTLNIDGTDVEFVVDTGASQMVLTQFDAQRIGLDLGGLRYTGTASTANGIVETAPVWLGQVSLGPHVDRDVAAVVNGGQMNKSLLGMTYLNRFDRLSITNEQLILTRGDP